MLYVPAFRTSQYISENISSLEAATHVHDLCPALLPRLPAEPVWVDSCPVFKLYIDLAIKL